MAYIEKDYSSLEAQIKVIEREIVVFFSNRFDDAKNVFARHPDLDNLVYYKAALSYMTFVFGAVTMEKAHVSEAFLKVNSLMSHARKMRKGSSLTSWLGLWKTDYNDYTDEECHAEMLYGEAHFMNLVLTFIDDPNFYSLFRAVLSLRQVYHSYRLGSIIAQEKTNWRTDALKLNFMEGYKLGWGMFNVLMSHLPDRCLKILSFVGYNCDREVGFALAKSVTSKQETYRAKILQFLICFYSLYVEQIYGSGTADIKWVTEVTEDALRKIPNSVFDLFYGARLKQITGNTSEAIDMFNRCIRTQHEFPALHNVATWDLLWSYAIQCDWRKASDCALFLEKTCTWSKATNLYQWACFQYMIMEEEGRDDLMPKIEEAMKRVPDKRKRFIGKTIPPEKFAITKAILFTNGRKLHLPAFELFYIWNIFGNTGGKAALLDPIYNRLAKKLKQLEGQNDEGMFMVLLLMGVCLRNYGRHDEAIECFQRILDAEKSLHEFDYVPPHAALEIGLSYLDVGRIDDSKKWLIRARDDYTGFLVESLAHLRIHGALCQIKYHS